MVLTTSTARSYTPEAMADDPVTERSRAAADLDLRPTQELVELMNDEDATVAGAVRAALPSIAAVVDAVAERLAAGGRLVYAGAGSSGRIAEADAAECEATFSAPPGQVIALAAADDPALEDDADAGASSVREAGVGPTDVVVAVSASGATRFAIGAARAAAAAGAYTACVVAVPDSELARAVEREILVVTGPEVIAGSTRLKAGTAQKLVLNTISTVSMIRLGRTFGDLMVDVVPGNDKLRARVRRLVGEATGAAPEDVERALAEAGGEAKVAILALLSDVDADTARTRLREAGGNLRHALAP
jgi:N-acetylmuramic acid 6-phosphate etherase